MKTKDLREWLFKNRLEDCWYVSAGGHLLQDQMTLSDIASYSMAHNSLKIQVLHPSMTDMKNPPWVDFDLDEEFRRDHAPSPASAQNFPPIPPKEEQVSPSEAGKRGVTRTPFSSSKKGRSAIKPGVNKDTLVQSVKKVSSDLKPVIPSQTSTTSGTRAPFGDKTTGPRVPTGKPIAAVDAETGGHIARETSSSFFSPLKLSIILGSCASIIIFFLFATSSEESLQTLNAAAQGGQTSLPGSTTAYNEGQRLIREQLENRGELAFPTHSSNGIVHYRITENFYRVSGFVRIKSGKNSAFETYDSVLQYENRAWKLLYLKAGETEYGEIPKQLMRNGKIMPQKP